MGISRSVVGVGGLVVARLLSLAASAEGLTIPAYRARYGKPLDRIFSTLRAHDADPRQVLEGLSEEERRVLGYLGGELARTLGPPRLQVGPTGWLQQR